MKRFGRFSIGLVTLAFDAGILAGLQWLSWYGPKWMTATIDGNVCLSPLVWIVGIALGFFITMWACIISE